ncbi:diguanylate cyclase/phosphodiesterase (GGDEF & EAL domains) with PAS/PAC sensor(s) [Sulfurimonas gotlandica GD1]|jgi:diguanylate cyclase (GGDEF)-like protein/PAS domain S-box-containing protein|uniref:Diguanylate cyclase/phosphodiesterase (GGDEF & EAL domains) with PAS/PAC sensor(S) n=1 Tax=Sulfurimonas gotlandica (strain DSM 19862 / JCM 16533 / GD1) TaxID=929558 RepID=B6BH14_SULGG|nr:EAL domain-containing protein [Sulfurimonas gotlandica]EDZ63332.1 diguanylate cyclase/phosphodiesterase [Sulfurimonas gotlandica GD1]EHP29798.1 diguanylate cyclase/phosphodiesterase (GGDEF & EAL domains) with PAS/PAC sensor(s) [Sulfurimonas gotlandica GD1]
MSDIEFDKLKKSNEELAYIVKHAVSEIYILDFETLDYVFANDGALQNIGYTLDELLKLNVYDINKTLTRKHVESLRASCAINDSVSNISEHTRKDGTSYTVQASIQSIIYQEKKAYVLFDTDISKLKKVQKELREQKDILHHQAHHDALTGLPNRILFNDRLSQGIKKSKRHNEILALFFIDLDQFKQINDSLGHDTGDVVLKEASRRFSSKIREEDTLSRLGGDEFSVIAGGLKEASEASVLANKFIECMAEPIVVGAHTLYLTCSIGISFYPQDGQSAENLLKYADVAMYKAKDEGRNNYQTYSSKLTELMHEQVTMRTSLHKALKNDEFILNYQPQIDSMTDRIIGMEALIRWNHPELGRVSPAKFIPLAEETGFIVELDRWVMQEAMSKLSSWYEEGLNPGMLALNLAMKQIQKSDFLEFLKNTMKETNCLSEWIELEVTEGEIMKNPDESIATLKEINKLGITLAIDDFGTGYSSLSYLKKLPVNKLKIDQSFIKDTPDDEDDVAITKAVIALAKSLKMSVIAEGVETKAQKDFLILNECLQIQGYYYSPPVDAQKMRDMLIEQKEKEA